MFIETMRDYSGYADPVWVLSLLPIWLVIPLLAVLLWAAIATFRRANTSCYIAFHTDGITLSIIMALMVLPQTGNYYLTLLIVPLLLIVQRAFENMEAKQVFILAGCLAAVISPWLIWMNFDDYRPIEAVVLPLLLFLLWWTQLQTTAPRRIATADNQG